MFEKCLGDCSTLREVPTTTVGSIFVFWGNSKYCESESIFLREKFPLTELYKLYIMLDEETSIVLRVSVLILYDFIVTFPDRKVKPNYFFSFLFYLQRVCTYLYIPTCIMQWTNETIYVSKSLKRNYRRTIEDEKTFKTFLNPPSQTISLLKPVRDVTGIRHRSCVMTSF